VNGPINFFGLTQDQFLTFVLVMIRVSVILFMLPIFSASQVSSMVRFGLGLAITFVVWHVVPPVTGLHGLGEFAPRDDTMPVSAFLPVATLPRLP